MTPRLLLVGSGSERYRRYLLEAIARRFDVWLINGDRGGVDERDGGRLGRRRRPRPRCDRRFRPAPGLRPALRRRALLGREPHPASRSSGRDPRPARAESGRHRRLSGQAHHPPPARRGRGASAGLHGGDDGGASGRDGREDRLPRRREAPWSRREPRRRARREPRRPDGSVRGRRRRDLPRRSVVRGAPRRGVPGRARDQSGRRRGRRPLPGGVRGSQGRRACPLLRGDRSPSFGRRSPAG